MPLGFKDPSPPCRFEKSAHSLLETKPLSIKTRSRHARPSPNHHQPPSMTIIVCGSLVPDPLQTLEPIAGPTGPALKNEMMLPSWLDPWAGHALYEAANLAAKTPGSKVYLVSLGPKAKLQQVMMTVAQKVPFELVALDGPAGGFTDAAETAAALAAAIQAIPGLDLANTLVFGGWESASRGAGATMQIIGEILGITEQFQGVDALEIQPDGSLKILERVEGNREAVVPVGRKAPLCGQSGEGRVDEVFPRRQPVEDLCPKDVATAVDPQIGRYDVAERIDATGVIHVHHVK